jgi:5-methylcytosine-specific restriction endonuclease McrA
LKTEVEVQHLIQKWISRCIVFIEDGGRGEVGKKILTADRNDVEARVGGKCPTCPTIMIERKRRRPDSRPDTITVEHIVPRTLGGNNVRDNLVAMCHDCNRCRNTTMTRLIPHHVSFHGHTLDSEERALFGTFIEWSIRTIHTPNSSRVSLLCTQLFDEAKLEGSATRKKKLLQRAARKAALSKVSNKKSKTILSKPKHDSYSEILSLLIEIRDTQKAILDHLQKTPFRRFMDWLLSPFRRASKSRLSHNRRTIEYPSLVNENTTTALVNEVPTPKSEEEAIEEIPVATAPIDAGEVIDNGGIDRFRTECIGVVNESMSPATFALRLGGRFEDMTAKEFAKSCGIPSSWSLLKAIETHISDLIHTDGIGTTAVISPVHNSNEDTIRTLEDLATVLRKKLPDEILLQQLGHRIAEWCNSDWGTSLRNASDVRHHLGIGKLRPMRKMLEDMFGNQVYFEGSGPRMICKYTKD